MGGDSTIPTSVGVPEGPEAEVGGAKMDGAIQGDGEDVPCGPSGGEGLHMVPLIPVYPSAGSVGAEPSSGHVGPPDQ